MLLLLLLWLAAPPPSPTPLQRGLLALSKGQTSEARTILEQASKNEPKNPLIWSSLAEAYRRTEDGGKAAAAAERAEQLAPEDPVVAHSLAIFYTESGKPDRAAPLEAKFAHSKRADRDALARTANLYLAANQPDRALPLAQEYLELGPSAAGEGLYGRCFMAAGRDAEALPHLKKAWEASPAEDAATFDYANALLRTQAFDQVVETVTQSLKRRPPSAQLELLLGVAEYGQRRFEDSIKSFLEVIHLDPEVEQPYIFLGRLLEQAGSQLPEVINADAAWAAKNPGSARAQLELAKALLQQNRNDPQAPGLLAKSIELDPNQWEAHYQLGVVLEGKRDFAGAEQELSRSAELDPKQSMPHYHLARVYDRLGRPKDAEAQRAIHTGLSSPGKED